MVMQKFHNLPGTEVPHRFYEVVARRDRRVVRLTPELLRVAESEDLPRLTAEVDARWRIVATSFSAGIGASLIADGLAVDIDRSMLTDKLRRRSVTGVTEAVIGFQYGRCLICDEPITPGDQVAVDHVFPFSFMRRGFPLGWTGLDLDAVWNLAPAHAVCKSAKSNALPHREQVARLARRNAAIMNSPRPLRRTLEITLKTWGFPCRPDEWPRFLAGVTQR